MKIKKENLLNILIFSLVFFIVIFIFYKLYGYSLKVDYRSLKFNIPYLILSFLMIPIWYFFMSIAYKKILDYLDSDVDLYTVMRIIGISMFGKYIPGKLWFTVGRVALLERCGIPKKKSFTAVILETYFLIFTAFLFFSIILFKIYPFKILYTISFIIFILLLFLFSIPENFSFVINILLKIFKKEKIFFNISFKRYFFILFLYILVWIFSGLEFYLLLYSFTNRTYDFIGVMSVYPSSWVIGFLSFFVPAGIGVREGMIFLILKNFTGPDIAIIGSFLSRIEVSIGELFYLVFFIGDKKIWRKNEKI